MVYVSGILHLTSSLSVMFSKLIWNTEYFNPSFFFYDGIRLHLVDIHPVFCPFIKWWYLSCSVFLLIMNNASMNVSLDFCEPVFRFLAYILRRQQLFSEDLVFRCVKLILISLLSLWMTF
jgi:hypothetical protein